MGKLRCIMGKKNRIETSAVFHYMREGRKYHPAYLCRVLGCSKQTMAKKLRALKFGGAVKVIISGRYKLYETNQRELF